MREYMFILRGGDESPLDAEEVSVAEIQKFIEPYQRWLDELKHEGRLKRADRLKTQGHIVQGRGADVMDAPLGEVKDLIGGYYIIQALHTDEALEYARRCPHLAHGGVVEVRELAGGEYE